MPGAPMIANTKSHGTNVNFKKSGMTNADGSPGGPPFLKGLGKMAGNFIKGKGPLGFMNPIGMIANKAGLFGGNKGGGNPNANQNTVATNTNTTPNPTADPTAQQIAAANTVPEDEQAGPVVDPNAGVSGQGTPPVA